MNNFTPSSKTEVNIAFLVDPELARDPEWQAKVVAAIGSLGGTDVAIGASTSGPTAETHPPSPSREGVFKSDFNAYLESYAVHGLQGRPPFRGEVKRGDVEAADYWIMRLTHGLEGGWGGEYLITLSAAFNYLSDLSTNEERCGGFNGLLGPDEDVVRLRQGLMRWLADFSEPGGHEYEPMKAYSRLFIRAIGLKANDAFVEHVMGGPKSGDYNPQEHFERLDAARRYAHMKTHLRSMLEI